MQLLQKLLTLGETIHQLRRNNQNHSHNNSAPNRLRHSARIRLQKACSESSLSSPAEDDNPTDYDGQTSEDLESELKVSLLNERDFKVSAWFNFISVFSPKSNIT